jgi:PKHD-type hydroxylase
MWSDEFSKNDCDQIISKAQKLPVYEAKVAQGEQHNVEDVRARSSKVCWIKRDDNHGLNDVFSTLDKYFKLANLHFGFNIALCEDFQFAEYNEGDQYVWHPDWFPETKNNYQRKLSLTMQLTDPLQYDGGDFQFHDLDNDPDVRSIKKQGAILIFPSYLVHRIRPVTRGRRYSLVAWCEGPEFK